MDPTSMIGGLAVGAITTPINYALAESHADKAFRRQKELLNLQASKNATAQVNAASQTVQGLKLAGLNPALAGSQPQTAQSVGLGTAPKAENVELDPQSLLLKAQADNLEADTAKKKAETGNVNEDTDLKFAQKLLVGANKDKVDEESKNLRNINDTFVAQNRALAESGKAMAEKWQSSDWYNRLAPNTKDTIDAIASGELPLTVGGMKALEQTVAFQRDLSDADRKVVSNAFDNAITEAMFNDKSVMDAIAKEPERRQKMLDSQIAKINAELPEIRAKVQNLLADTSNKKLSAEQIRSELDSFKRNDLGYLKSKGDYGKWLESYAEQLLQGLFPMVVGGAALRSANKAIDSSPKTKDGPRGPFTSYNNPNTSGLHSFKF